MLMLFLVGHASHMETGSSSDNDTYIYHVGIDKCNNFYDWTGKRVP